VSRVATGLPRFNRLSDDEARAELATCLDVPRWCADVAVGRPYESVGELEQAAERAWSDPTDDELEAALARHPRIGERAGAGHDAEHSAREQSGVDRRDAEVRRRLEEGNRAYEERFGRVFLIRAAGRDGREILDELERRLRNDDVTEREETIEQLRQIAILRLDELVR
jgi:2-oxo-4-hydroxy-4-carboxy-5-ureidoimidazoline decarboxylase